MNHRVKAWGAAIGLLVSLLAACGGPRTATGPNILSFSYTAGAAGATQFHWTVTGTSGGPITCTIDTNTNGTPDTTVQDCGTTTTTVYTYASPGSHTATLTATDGNLTSTTTTTVIANGTSSTPYTWLRQLGSSRDDVVRGAAVDGDGNTFVAGSTTGDLGRTNIGQHDAFLAKYDSNGIQLWLRQFGTVFDEYANSVATDASGSAVVVGATDAHLPPPSPATGNDLLLEKYTTDNQLVWGHQYGTTSDDWANAVATDADGNIFVGGFTAGAFPNHTNAGNGDAFIAKYDSNGQSIWVQQFGTSALDSVNGLAVDANGNVYATGYTTGALAGPNSGSYDAFLVKYDRDGNLTWQVQFGTSNDDEASAVAVDANGNAVATGNTGGALGGPNAGFVDVFVVKYDSSGVLVWQRQFGTSTPEYPYGIVLDPNSQAIITGWTLGALAGPSAGDTDVFVAKYDATGNEIWTRQFGTSDRDAGYGASVDGNGQIRIVGATYGALGGASAGSRDAFVAMYVP